MKSVLMVIIFIFGRFSQADGISMTEATWKSCGEKSCYSIQVERGGLSGFIPQNFFFKGVRLSLFHLNNKIKPYLQMTADRGIWIENENRWVLLKARNGRSMSSADYYFLAGPMILAKSETTSR